MEYRTHLEISFGNSKGLLDHPKPMVLGNDFLGFQIGVGDIPLPSVPSLVRQNLLLVDGDADVF